MLKIITESFECFDDETSTFVTFAPCVVYLEHSLLSISEWEATYHKSFFSKEEKTTKEVFDYIKMMVVNEVDDKIIENLSKENLDKINDYLLDSRTGTKFYELKPQNQSLNHLTTSEEIYYQMLKLNIPFECERWNINRLSTLIKVCYIKENGNSNKMGRNEILARNRELNEARKAKLKTKG